MADARVFFALWPDAQTAAAIDTAADTLASDGRRVARSDLHLTLAFLGRVQSSTIDDLKLKAGTVRVPSFTLALDRIGYFARPRVLWLGPADAPDALPQLAQALATIAPVPTQPPAFRPHVSLCRRVPAPEPGLRIEPIVWPVRSFCLIESGSDGVPGRYGRLGRWPLA